jgi:membrane-bound inhibitor of C-type lysozyme
MRSISLLCLALALGSISGAVLAAPPMQPPMNDFNQAFYRCDNGDAFMMSYDAEDAKTATLAGNHDNKRRELKRTASDSGVQYAGDHLTFWTDGKTVRVEGALAFKNCKMKTG